MTFRGSIDPIGTHELLRRVAAHDSPGMLTIYAPGVEQQVWIGYGDVATDPSTTPIDAVVKILDGDGGSFLFEPDRAAPARGNRAPFAETLDRASALHDELAEVIAIVPSPEHHLRWRPRLDVRSVDLQAAEWALLVAAAHSTTTGELAPRFDSELLARRAVAELVKLRLIDVFEVEVPSPVIVPERTRRRAADYEVDGDLEFAMLPPADVFFARADNDDEHMDETADADGDDSAIDGTATDESGLARWSDAPTVTVGAGSTMDVGDLSDWHVSEEHLVIDESGWATSRPIGDGSAGTDDSPDGQAAVDPNGWAASAAPARDAVGWGDEHVGRVDDRPVGWEDAVSAPETNGEQRIPPAPTAVNAADAAATDAELLSRAQIYQFLSSMRT